jgi:hypothetical protein
MSMINKAKIFSSAGFCSTSAVNNYGNEDGLS